MFFYSRSYRDFDVKLYSNFKVRAIIDINSSITNAEVIGERGIERDREVKGIEG